VTGRNYFLHASLTARITLQTTAPNQLFPAASFAASAPPHLNCKYVHQPTNPLAAADIAATAAIVSAKVFCIDVYAN
jgi:hypothetical protein